ncbi:MAG: DUF3737 family protein [Lachnospiraceae bacterium]|nr:DUF3737 family protein [Lachnospiraceae bacterium]
MKEYVDEMFTGERALYRGEDLQLHRVIFDDGESPLKHSKNVDAQHVSFRWKYPLWYAENATVRDSSFFQMSRSGVWYGKNITIENTMIEAPKEFRRCDGVHLKNVSLPHAQETLWTCKNVTLEQVVACGDYFGKDSDTIVADGLDLYGNYCFDGAKNIEIRNSRLLSKDSFWNTENVVVRDSYIVGEYLGWNSKNLTFENCIIESLQGFCYIENLTLKDCTLTNTSLAFEYSTVDVDVKGPIDSIINPLSGRIVADEIGVVVLDREWVGNGQTEIIARNGQAPKYLTSAEVELTSGQGHETELKINKKND